MEEFIFTPFKIVDKRVNLKDHNINSYNLLEFIFLSSTPRRIALIFNDLIESKAIKIEEDQEYEVEAILDETDEEGEKKYLVKWKNWHVEFCTWEPLENLVNCKKEFMLYEKRKLDNKNIGVDYLQPKMELIRQIMTVITECSVRPHHVYKYLPSPTSGQTRRGTKRKLIDNQQQQPNNILGKSKRSKKVINTVKQALQDWEDLINRTYPLFKVTVENKFDTEGPPLDFMFITDYTSSSIEIPKDPPIGCHCSSKCSDNKRECSSIHGGSPPYGVSGKILIPPGQPVYECNSTCSCGKECPYRVVQNGVKLNLTIFRTTNRGWGLKTINKISKGMFIMEYLGEIITVDEAEERGKLYDQQNLTYLFDLDFAGDPEFTIDAYKVGNLAHFINHSCNPNMASRCVYINNLDIRMPRIAFFAVRNIHSGEELTFDYMMTGVITAPNPIITNNNVVSPSSGLSNPPPLTTTNGTQSLAPPPSTSVSVDNSNLDDEENKENIGDCSSPPVPGTVGSFSAGSDVVSSSASSSAIVTDSKKTLTSQLGLAADAIFMGTELASLSVLTATAADNSSEETRMTTTTTTSTNDTTSGDTGAVNSGFVKIPGRVKCLCKSHNCRKYLY